MTTKKLQNKNRKTVKAIAVYATIFTISFVLLYSPTLIEAAGCGTINKFTTGGFHSESGARYGDEGKIQAKAVNICGTTNNQSYAHTTIAMTTASNGDFVEAGVWKGYGAGFTTGSDLHYNIISDNNAFGGPGNIFRDITDTTSLKPAINDNVKYTVYWDYNSGFPLFRDHYKVIINNPGKHTITTSNIWSNGKGIDPITQAEILNHDSWMKSEADILKDYSTSQTWSAWTSGSVIDIPSGSSNPLCGVEDANDNYRFRIDSGATCSTG